MLRRSDGDYVVTSAQWSEIRSCLQARGKLEDSKLYNFDMLPIRLDFVATDMPSGRRQVAVSVYGWQPGARVHDPCFAKSDEFLKVYIFCSYSLS